MSGICGIVFREADRPLNSEQVAAMVQAQDSVGHGKGFVASLGRVGMGGQRSPGRPAGVTEATLQGQPITLAFHGNLYNLAELSCSHNDGDYTSGLLRLYLQDGIDFLQKLRGEFAVALWDGREETLYLATDRFRVNPLFYYHDQEKLVFASRMKGVLACPFPIRQTINPEAIVDVVASSVIPTPKTIWSEVRKLPPGHVLTYRKGDIKLTPYWGINFLQTDDSGEKELARKLKVYFADAVSVRLETDGVPDRIGTFLSGGVDSSTVTGVVTKLLKRPIKSFSIGFDEAKFNEIDYARIAARAFGSEHHEYFVTPRDTYDAIPLLMGAFDEPYANASAVPTYFCAKLAKEHGIDVLYAGDGGDELFAGNERYAAERLFDYYYRIPKWLRESIVKPVVFNLADGLNLRLLKKAKKYIQRASIPYPQRLTSYGLFKIVPMSDLFEEDLLKSLGSDYDPYGPVYSHYYEAPAKTELDRQLYIDLKLAISDNDLFKVTRMTEAAGITVRFPFLDHPLAEFAASIPAGIKMQGRQLRSFFKKAYADLLPLEIRTKTKHGFGLPIPGWLRTDKHLNEMMHDLVLSAQSVQRGYFRKKALEGLVECHRTDQTSFYGTILWNLMVLELWHRTHLNSITVLSEAVGYAPTTAL